MTKITNTYTTNFNADLHVKELNERFKQLINNNFPLNNRKGTDRYDLEVNFAYALNEIKQSPVYMQGKMFDKATSIVSRLISMINKKEVAVAA